MAFNHRETIVKHKLESEGWIVLRNGHPDILAVKIDDNNNIIKIKANEVKSPTDKLSKDQLDYKHAFLSQGIEYDIWVVDTDTEPPSIDVTPEISNPYIVAIWNKFPLFDPSWGKELQESWFKTSDTIKQIKEKYQWRHNHDSI
jgi:hypothetical protein